MSAYKVIDHEYDVVVLGAGGFFGSHMVKRLKKENFYVIGVDLKKPEFSKSLRFFLSAPSSSASMFRISRSELSFNIFRIKLLPIKPRPPVTSNFI